MYKIYLNKSHNVEQWVQQLSDNNEACTARILTGLKEIYNNKDIMEMINSPAYERLTYNFDSLNIADIKQVETYLALSTGRDYSEMELLLQDVGDVGDITTVLKMTSMPNNSLVSLLKILKLANLKTTVISYEKCLIVSGKGIEGLREVMNIANSVKESYKLDRPTFKRAFNQQ